MKLHFNIFFYAVQAQINITIRALYKLGKILLMLFVWNFMYYESIDLSLIPWKIILFSKSYMMIEIYNDF